MRIKSILTDYICHIVFFIWHRPLDFIKEQYKEWRLNMYVRWYEKAVRRSRTMKRED